MTIYIKNDMQNIFTDFRNKNALTTTIIYYKIPRIILRDYFNNA